MTALAAHSMRRRACPPSTTSSIGRVMVCLALAAAFVSTAPCAVTASAVNVGGGSSLAAAVYNAAIFAYRFVDPDFAITYEPVGSTAGRNGLLRPSATYAATGGYRYDWAGSDSLPTAADALAAPDLFAVPTLSAAVVAVYNLPSANATSARLVLDRTTLPMIFLGNITHWDDARLVALNPTLRLPHQRIAVVVRSDGSGTTGIWTELLSDLSPVFAACIGRGESVNWRAPYPQPNLRFGSGNTGIGVAVKRTPWSIGYSVQQTAIQLAVPYASYALPTGAVLTANLTTVTFASLELQIGGKIADSQANAWPITGFTYVVFRGRTTRSGGSLGDRAASCVARQKMVAFWLWFYSSQTVFDLAASLGYALLPVFIQEVLQIQTQLHTRIYCNATVLTTATAAGSTSTSAEVGASDAAATTSPIAPVALQSVVKEVLAYPLVVADRNSSAGISMATPLFTLLFESYTGSVDTTGVSGGYEYVAAPSSQGALDALAGTTGALTDADDDDDDDEAASSSGSNSAHLSAVVLASLFQASLSNSSLLDLLLLDAENAARAADADPTAPDLVTIVIKDDLFPTDSDSTGAADATVKVDPTSRVLQPKDVTSAAQTVQVQPVAALPTALFAVLPVYYLPGRLSTDPPLALTLRVIWKLWLGRITSWRHPDIAALNPALSARGALPDGNLTFVVNAFSTPESDVFRDAVCSLYATDAETTLGLSARAATLRAASEYVWCLNATLAWAHLHALAAQNGGVNTITVVDAPSSDELEAALLTGGGAAGGLSYMFWGPLVAADPVRVLTDSTAASPSYALNITTLTNCVTQSTILERAVQLRNPSPAPLASQPTSCWPFAGLLSSLVHMNFAGADECRRGTAALTFLQWLYTSPELDDAAASVNFATLPEVARTAALNTLYKATCNGQSILQPPLPVYTLSPTLLSVTQALSAFGMAFAIFLAFALYRYRNSRVMRSASVFYLAQSIVGAVLMYLAMWVLTTGGTGDGDGPTEASCGVSLWVGVLGFSVCFGPLFAKTYRIYRIFNVETLKKIVLTDRMLLWYVGIPLAGEALLLAAWQATDPLTPTQTVLFLSRSSDSTSSASVATSVTYCGTQGLAFPIIFGAWKAVLLVLGCVLAFLTRDVVSDFNESHHISFALWNCAFTFAVLVPLTWFVRASSLDAMYLLLALSIFWVCTSTLLFLFGPKILRTWYFKNSNTSNNNTGAGGNGGAGANGAGAGANRGTQKDPMSTQYGGGGRGILKHRVGAGGAAAPGSMYATVSTWARSRADELKSPSHTAGRIGNGHTNGGGGGGSSDRGGARSLAAATATANGFAPGGGNSGGITATRPDGVTVRLTRQPTAHGRNELSSARPVGSTSPSGAATATLELERRKASMDRGAEPFLLGAGAGVSTSARKRSLGSPPMDPVVEQSGGLTIPPQRRSGDAPVLPASSAASMRLNIPLSPTADSAPVPVVATPIEAGGAGAFALAPMRHSSSRTSRSTPPVPFTLPPHGPAAVPTSAMVVTLPHALRSNDSSSGLEVRPSSAVLEAAATAAVASAAAGAPPTITSPTVPVGSSSPTSASTVVSLSSAATNTTGASGSGAVGVGFSHSAAPNPRALIPTPNRTAARIPRSPSVGVAAAMRAPSAAAHPLGMLDSPLQLSAPAVPMSTAAGDSVVAFGSGATSQPSSPSAASGPNGPSAPAM